MFFTVSSGVLLHDPSIAQTGGNRMSGGRFYPELEINEHGCLTPAGLLELAKGETVLRLDAWIWQKGGVCVAVQHEFPNREQWEITTDPEENHEGAHFEPGVAAAMAIMVVSKVVNGKRETKTVQWTDAVLLLAHQMPSKTSQSAAKSEELVTS
jgi:hypothetical protein